jgi:glycosyltransferase involved in cell wall biosynthesis
VWTRFEKDLFNLSHGIYQPARVAKRRRIQTDRPVVGTGVNIEVAGRVSIVVPTMSSRQRYHEQLWANFEAQTWPDKELIVVESYEDYPSEFLRQKAQEDDRLVHVCFRRSLDEDFSVGLKRNMTLHLASGEFIVNFDDDDVYAASYVQRMVGEMRARGLVGITLSAWYNYFVSSGEIGYTDPTVAWEVPPSQMPKDEMEEVLYGYGFSYVHTRRAALALPYPDVEFAEDAPFFIRLKQVFGSGRVVLKKDKVGLCMHLVHRANSAGDMPIARNVGLLEADTLDVAPIFQRFLESSSSIRSVIASFDLAVQSFSDLWRRAPVTKHKRVKSC